MDDFNEYVKNSQSNSQNEPTDLFHLVGSIASKYNGKDRNELLMAIYKEAKKGKEQGTLTNADIDRFANMISPLLDEKQRKMLVKIANELKKI